MNRFNDCKAVLTDNDGTLVDTEAIKVKVFTSMVAKLGITLTKEDIQGLYGKLDRNCYVDFVVKYHIQRNPLELLAEHTAEYNRKLREVTEALPGAHQLLTALCERDIPIGVCSGSDREQLDIIYRQLGWAHLFRHITSAESTERHKPHPAPYLHAIEHMGVSAKYIVALEDSAAGVASAKAAGIGYIIGVMIGNHGTQDLQQADVVVHSLVELLK